jgi:hypothetical protein
MFIGSEELTTIELRTSKPSTLCLIESLGEDAFEIQNFSTSPIELVKTPRL